MTAFLFFEDVIIFRIIVIEIIFVTFVVFVVFVFVVSCFCVLIRMLREYQFFNMILPSNG